MNLASLILLLGCPLARAFAPRRGVDRLGLGWSRSSGAANTVTVTAKAERNLERPASGKLATLSPSPPPPSPEADVKKQQEEQKARDEAAKKADKDGATNQAAQDEAARIEAAAKESAERKKAAAEAAQKEQEKMDAALKKAVAAQEKEQKAAKDVQAIEAAQAQREQQEKEAAEKALAKVKEQEIRQKAQAEKDKARMKAAKKEIEAEQKAQAQRVAQEKQAAADAKAKLKVKQQESAEDNAQAQQKENDEKMKRDAEQQAKQQQDQEAQQKAKDAEEKAKAQDAADKAKAQSLVELQEVRRVLVGALAASAERAGSDHSHKAPRHEIAMLVAVSSRGKTLESAEDTDFFKMLFPSFLKTTTPKEGFKYSFYVAYDVGDTFYDSSEGREEFEQVFLRQGGGTEPLVLETGASKNAANESSIAATRARLRWVNVAPYEDGSTGPVRAWNVAFQEAFSDGAAYFYQLGEDIELRTPGWARALTDQLHKQGDVGIVGGTELNYQAKKDLMPCVIVPRSHMSIFGTFFPTSMHNWWSDDWIMNSYKPFGLATKVPSVEIQNQRSTRYEVPLDDKAVAEDLAESSREQIREYLKLTGQASKVQVPSTDSSTERLESPMRSALGVDPQHKRYM